MVNPVPHRNVGGSMLPSNDRQVLEPKVGKHGTFVTRVIAELDSHALLFVNEGADGNPSEHLIAMHPNGYTCDHIAKRLIAAWETGAAEKVEDAVFQFIGLLRCGGVGISVKTFRALAEDAWTVERDDAWHRQD